MINYFFAAIIGYLLGSFPTAYLFVKYFKNKDITSEGSKNVGALNSFRVSESKIIALAVLIIDFTKGFLSVWITKELFGDSFNTLIIALFFSVLGHCFSPWIKFKGGRGLATAAGSAILVSYPILILWIIFWIAAYLFRKHIHFASVSASVLTGILVITSGKLLNRWGNFYSENLLFFMISVDMVFLLILIRHLPTMKEYFNQQNKKLRKD